MTWRWETVDGERILFDGERVVLRLAYGTMPPEETERIIAAAPDLLAALKGLVSGMNEAEDSRPLVLGSEVKKARAAVSKAEGR